MANSQAMTLMPDSKAKTGRADGSITARTVPSK